MRGFALLLAIASVSAVASGSDGASSHGQPLPDVGGSLKRSIAPGETHGYSVALEACESVDVVVEQLGVDVTVAFLGPDGKDLIEIDSPNGDWEAEGLLWAAEMKGTYTLEVRASPDLARGGLYELALRARHFATPAVARLMEGEAHFARGVALQRDESASTQRQAVATFEKAFAIFVEVGDLDREALTLDNIALADHNYLGESARAVEGFERAIAIFRQLGRRRLEADTLMGLGIAHYRLQQMPEAIAIFEEALAMQRELGNAANEAQVLSNLGMVYDALGEKERAIAHMLRALPILRTTENLQVEQWTLNNLALAYEYQGELQKALGAYEAALRLCRRVSARKDESRLLANLGRLCQKLGDEERGELYLKRAAAIARELKDPGAEAAALRNLARSQVERGDMTAAIATDEMALALARQAKDATFETIVLNALSASVASQGDSRRALELAEAALSLARHGGNLFSEGLAETNMGIARAALGQVEEARAELGKAVGIRRGIGDRMGVAQSEIALARLERDDDRLEAALGWVRQALEILESLRSEVLGHDLRASFFGTLQRHYGFAVDLLMRMHAADPRSGSDALALEAAERARARSLLDLLSEAKAGLRLGVDRGLFARDETLRKQIGSRLDAQVRLLSGRHTEQQAAEGATALDALRLERQRLEEEILRSNPRYAELSQPRPSTVPDIQTALGGDTLLLEYAFGEGQTFLWAVTSDAIRAHALAPAADVERAARRFYEAVTERNRKMKFESPAERRARIARGDAETPGLASALGRMLLQPVAEELGERRIVVVAEGALQYVPFGALIVGASRDPLAFRHEIVALPSASVLSALRRKTADRKPPAGIVAVLADPVFDAGDERVRTTAGGSRQQPGSTEGETTSLEREMDRSISETGAGESGSRLKRLRSTRREAEAILALSPGRSKASLDFDASRETATSGALADYRIVHFATHSLLNTLHPDLSGIVLSLVDREGRPMPGFLSAADVFDLELPADLVVLSACRTALGKEIRGEGLVGLTRGFFHAGAARVISSLWKVDDAATAVLMTRLYRGILRERRSPADALRRAQIAIARESRRHAPYFWAGFLLQGEWEDMGRIRK